MTKRVAAGCECTDGPSGCSAGELGHEVDLSEDVRVTFDHIGLEGSGALERSADASERRAVALARATAAFGRAALVMRASAVRCNVAACRFSSQCVALRNSCCEPLTCRRLAEGSGMGSAAPPVRICSLACA